MHQDRLNHLMILHVHKQCTNELPLELPLEKCVNELFYLTHTGKLTLPSFDYI